MQDRGSIYDYIPYLIAGVKHGKQDLGIKSVRDMHKALYSGELRFERRSAAARGEGKIYFIIYVLKSFQEEFMVFITLKRSFTEFQTVIL